MATLGNGDGRTGKDRCWEERKDVVDLQMFSLGK